MENKGKITIWDPNRGKNTKFLIFFLLLVGSSQAEGYHPAWFSSYSSVTSSHAPRLAGHVRLMSSIYILVGPRRVLIELTLTNGIWSNLSVQENASVNLLGPILEWLVPAGPKFKMMRVQCNSSFHQLLFFQLLIYPFQEKKTPNLSGHHGTRHCLTLS